MLKAIDTRYAGHLFRSRLEARWAVAFDSLGLRWEYEKEGFELPSGARYLPDFWLPDVNGGCWIEVKPYIDGICDMTVEEKVFEFAQNCFETKDSPHEASTIYQVNGLPPVDISSDYGHSNCHRCCGVYLLSWPYDNCHDWCICPITGKVGIHYESRSDRITSRPSAKKSNHGDRGHNATHPRLIAAWTAANSARFEHGATGGQY